MTAYAGVNGLFDALTDIVARLTSSGGLGGTATPKGYVQITDLSAAVGLGSIPAGATTAFIVSESAPVRWRDDGTNPSTSVGMLLNEPLRYSGSLSAIKFIQLSVGGKLNVAFY